jgi:formyltetrahydrofolate synthetase
VLVCTIRALKHHAGLEDPNADRAVSRAALETGAHNLRRHIGIVKEFGLPCVVAVNRRPGDTNEELELVRKLALEFGADSAEVNEGFERGGEGAAKLAEAVVAAADTPSDFRFIYRDEDPIIDKIEAIAKRVYGASGVYLYPEAEKKIVQYTKDGLDRLPICMAKTQYSLSADPQLLNAPEGFTLPVRDIRAYTGAGWLVPLCGDIMQMPGLGTNPAAFSVDIEPDGRIVGLF